MSPLDLYKRKISKGKDISEAWSDERMGKYMREKAWKYERTQDEVSAWSLGTRMNVSACSLRAQDKGQRRLTGADKEGLKENGVGTMNVEIMTKFAVNYSSMKHTNPQGEEVVGGEL